MPKRSNRRQSNGTPGVGDSAGTATLTISLAYPPSAFVYRATKPRLLVNGVDVGVARWGKHRVPVTVGRHRVQVWVPYVLPRKAGRAQTDIAVSDGEVASIAYMAPAVTFARGSLGAPGQKSTGLSTVRALNAIAIVVAVAVLLVLLVANLA